MAEQPESDYQTGMLIPTIILIAGIFLVLVAPWILTRAGSITSFENTGPIGDTIGGTTAPIIGLVSALLVYYAFLAQIQANRLTQRQIKKQEEENTLSKNFNNLLTLITKLESALDSFSTPPEKAGVLGASSLNPLSNEILTGQAAINRVVRRSLSNNKEIHDSSSSQLHSLLDFFIECAHRIENTKLAENDRSILHFLLRQMFDSKIISAFIGVPRVNDPSHTKTLLQKQIEEMRDLFNK